MVLAFSGPFSVFNVPILDLNQAFVDLNASCSDCLIYGSSAPSGVYLANQLDSGSHLRSGLSSDGLRGLTMVVARILDDDSRISHFLIESPKKFHQLPQCLTYLRS